MTKSSRRAAGWTSESPDFVIIPNSRDGVYHLDFWRPPSGGWEALCSHDCWNLTFNPFIPCFSSPPPPPSSLSGVGVTRQLRSLQVFPAGGEHGDRRVLLGRRLPAAALPGSLSVDEGPAAVPQPLPAGEAQVSVNHITQDAPRPGTAPPRCTVGKYLMWGFCIAMWVTFLFRKVHKSVHTTSVCLSKCFCDTVKDMNYIF